MVSVTSEEARCVSSDNADVGCICCDKICFQAKPVYTLVRITIGFVSLPLLFIEDKESSGLP